MPAWSIIRKEDKFDPDNPSDSEEEYTENARLSLRQQSRRRKADRDQSRQEYNRFTQKIGLTHAQAIVASGYM